MFFFFKLYIYFFVKAAELYNFCICIQKDKSSCLVHLSCLLSEIINQPDFPFKAQCLSKKKINSTLTTILFGIKIMNINDINCKSGNS